MSHVTTPQNNPEIKLQCDYNAMSEFVIFTRPISYLFNLQLNGVYAEGDLAGATRVEVTEIQ